MESVVRELGSLIGAVIGAALGAAGWAMVAVMSGYEYSFIALIVGMLVGGGSLIFGGRGIGQGMLCGVIALVAIFGGKMLAANYLVGQEVSRVTDTVLSKSQYDEIAAEAQDFNFDGTNAEYREFMIIHDYSPATTADEVSDEELQWFMQEHMGRLVAFQESQPTYEEWRLQYEGAANSAFSAEMSAFDITIASLDATDLLFGALGIATAFQIGALGNDDE